MSTSFNIVEIQQANVRIWSAKRTRDKNERSWDSKNVNLWCAVHVNHVFDAYYFASLTAIGASCKNSLTNSILSMLPTLASDTIFVQDEVPPYYCLEMRQLLNEKLANWIGRGGSIPRSACLSNLSPLYFSMKITKEWNQSDSSY